MGYPNPHESDYDLFMTGHAGCSVSTAVGLRSGDILGDQADRRTVAVIGDGAFPSGIVFEAMNNAGELEDDLTIVLNDNKMSICPRVGAVASYLDRLRSNPFYTGLKSEVVKLLDHVPMFGDPAERFLAQMKEGVKAGLAGRHAVRGIEHSLRRSDRRTRHRLGAQVPGDGPRDEGARAAARGDRKRTRLQTGRGRSGLFSHASGIRGPRRSTRDAGK